MKKTLKYIFQLLFLIITILLFALFINSCSMINKGSKISEENLINNFATKDKNYSVSFKRNKTGIFTNYKENILINFDYKYDSGTAICSYESNQKNNELVFNFIDNKLLYLSTYNLVLIQQK